MRKKLFDYISLEERKDGKAIEENELVFYCKLSDPEVLKKAESFEDQEQWTYEFVSFNNISVRIRNRKTIKDNVEEYVQTTKLVDKSANNLVYSEVPITSTKDGFEQFKKFCEKGMIKRRFNFPFKVQDKEFIFEVDVFLNDDGTYKEWVKIDLELEKDLENLADWKTFLPSEFTEVIVQRGADAQTQQKISELYQTVFSIKNKS